MSPPPLQAIIFDVDGTLAETEELHREAFNAAFAAAGLPWHWDQPTYAQLLKVTGGKERIAHYAQHHAPATKLDPAAIATLHRDKTARYAAALTEGHIELRPGIARLIAEAQQAGIRLAIATTTTLQNVTTLLAATLGHSPFEVIAAGDDVPAKKPAPDVYTLALERLQLPPTACIAIEDTINGLQSATAAGIPCVITTSTYGERDGFGGALAVVPNLDGGTGEARLDLTDLRTLCAVASERL